MHLDIVVQLLFKKAKLGKTGTQVIYLGTLMIRYLATDRAEIG